MLFTRRRHPSALRLGAVVLGGVALAFALAAPPARAEDGAWIDVPDVLHHGRIRAPILVQTLVPDVVGRTSDEVLETLGDVYALDVEYVRASVRSDGRVVGQVPRAGRLLPLRGRLRLQVAQATTLVPSVRGMRLRRAVAVLREGGLEAEVVPAAWDRNVPRGIVVRQHPRAGRRVAYGEHVRLVVARPFPGGAIETVPPFGRRGSNGRIERGPRRTDRVRVPYLLGLRGEEAAGRLQALGLRVRFADGSAAGGHVRHQGVAPGESVPRDTVVELLVSPPLPDRNRTGTHRRR